MYFADLYNGDYDIDLVLIMFPKLSAALIFAHFVRELAPSGHRFFGYFLCLEKQRK
jgi:hypothetical protein